MSKSSMSWRNINNRYFWNNEILVCFYLFGINYYWLCFLMCSIYCFYLQNCLVTGFLIIVYWCIYHTRLILYFDNRKYLVLVDFFFVTWKAWKWCFSWIWSVYSIFLKSTSKKWSKAIGHVYFIKSYVYPIFSWTNMNFALEVCLSHSYAINE